MAISSTSSQDGQPPGFRKALAGTIAGQVVEWYDYLLYGYVAADIASIYFPVHSRTASLLAALAVFGLTFVMRPIGGVFWSHRADRHGRTPILAGTILLMSVATALFGVIPGYHSIGIWAPALVLLVRLVQGFSAGGEANFGMTLVMEYTTQRNRCFYLGFLTIGIAISAILAAGLPGLVSAIAGPSVYAAWAWRIPFWLALPLGLVGLFLRISVAETPVFKEVLEKGQIHKIPVMVALRRYKTRIPLLIIFFGANAVVGYYLAGFLPAYLQTTGGLSKAHASIVLIAAYAVEGLAAVGFGHLTDLYGRRFIRTLSLGLMFIIAIPAIALASFGIFALAIVGLLLLAIAFGASQIATYTANTELYDADVRASAGAFAYNIAYVAFGGTAPIVGTALANLAGPYAAGGYVAVMSLVAFIAVIRMPETKLGPSVSPSPAGAIAGGSGEVPAT